MAVVTPTVYTSIDNQRVGEKLVELENYLKTNFKQAATQADSVAADVTTLKTDFNALLAKLRAAGLMA